MHPSGPRRTSSHWTAVLAAVCCLASIQSGFAASEIADAVMRGNSSRLDELLREGADVNAPQADGATALHWAAYTNDLETARRLVAAGARPGTGNRVGMTPFALAAIAGNADMLRLLLDAGADVDAVLGNGETPLMLAARTGSVAAIDVLLDAGAEIDAKESLRGTTALMWAAANANPQAVARLLERGADPSLRAAIIERGRDPYLAPSARERIEEFEQGTGLRGAVVAFDLDADSPEDAPAEVAAEDAQAETSFFNRPRERDWGGLTALIFAAREGDIESARALVAAGADVNQTSEYGWTPLLTATQNRYYRLGRYLLEQGADPDIANKGGWNPLYIATDNRNIEGGDYPTRKPDMEHLEYIRLLLDHGADPNQRMRSSTETRTIFTHQWLYEEGATPFLRASQSGDLELMRLLLDHGADPSIPTEHNVTPLMVASGIGWVEGVTHEWSPEQTYAAIELLLELGADVNARDTLDGRTALMGAAHKGRSDVVQLLADHGADLAARDIGSRDSIHALAGVTWQAIDYADGLVRVGVQSAIPHPETAALIRRLMTERGLPTPPPGRTLDSICITDVCK